MKKFHDFKPAEPFHFSEDLQINNRKIILSHVPLKNNVSINGFLPSDTYGDIKTNTYWCDYREADGYRSANGEVFFDSSRNGEFIHVDYLAVGTVLHAADMNEISDSLQHLDSVSTEIAIQLGDFGIHSRNYFENAMESVEAHNKSADSHADIRDSLSALNENIDYRFGTVSIQAEGLKNTIGIVANNLQKEIETVAEGNTGLISEANKYTDEQISKYELIMHDIKTEINTVYRQIDDGDEYIENRLNSLSSAIENQFATERKSALTARSNLKTEVYNRTTEQINTSITALNQEWSSVLKASERGLSADIIAVNERVNQAKSDVDQVYSKILENQTTTDTKFDEYSSKLQSLSADFESVASVTYENLDSLTSEYANLARIVYQAREAVNRQLDSMSTDVALANQNLTYSRGIFESKVDYLNNLTESVESGFDALVDSYENELDQMSADMQNFFDSLVASFNSQQDSIMSEISDTKVGFNQTFDSLMTSFNDRFDEMILGAANAQSQFSAALDSMDNAIIRFNTIEENLVESMKSAVDLSATETSITNLNNYMWILHHDVEDSLNDLIENQETAFRDVYFSLNHMEVDLTPVEESIKSLQDYVDNMDVDFSPVESSITALNNNISNLTSRVSNLESKGNTLTLTTTPGTANGAMWYVI